MPYKQVLSLPFPPFIDRQPPPLQGRILTSYLTTIVSLTEFAFIKVDLQRFTFIFKLGPQAKSKEKNCICGCKIDGTVLQV